MRGMKDLWDLYWTYLKIGCVNFGGGYAMLPLLERVLVNKKGWTTMDELRDYFAIGQCTPGIIALNVSTFIGTKRKGTAGALAAALGFLTCPIALIILICIQGMYQLVAIAPIPKVNGQELKEMLDSVFSVMSGV